MASALRVRLLLLLALGLALALGSALAARNPSQVRTIDLDAIPLTADGVTGAQDRLDAEIADMLQASQTLTRSVHRDGQRYWLYVGYFGQQGLGSQIHSPRHCYPSGGWNILSQEQDQRLGGPSGELLIQRDKERRVVLYQYLSRGGATTSELRLKLELLLGSLLGRPTDAACLLYSTPLARDETKAEALDRLGRFAREIQPAVLAALPF